MKTGAVEKYRDVSLEAGVVVEIQRRLLIIVWRKNRWRHLVSSEEIVSTVVFMASIVNWSGNEMTEKNRLGLRGCICLIVIRYLGKIYDAN